MKGLKEKKELTVFWTVQDGRVSDELLREAASRFAGLSPEECETVRERWKKPVFRFRPELHASVSHSGGVWACALTAEGEVGLDIQTRTAPQRMEQIARRYFHPDEAAAVLSAEDPAEAFMRIWCRKEAAVKQSGRGIDGRFGAFRTVCRGAEDGLADPDGAPLDILGAELYLTEFRIPARPDLFCCAASLFPCEIRLTAMD